MQSEAFDKKVSELKPSNGIERDKRAAVATQLGGILADSYVLFANTQGLHWNVEGPWFYGIHKLTEEQYEDQFEAIDDIAERIRALGFPSPVGLATYTEHSELDSFVEEMTVKAMIEKLITDNEQLAHRMRESVRVAEDAHDVKSADLLTDRIGTHEENAWMLRATIAGSAAN